jgi:hypothetical protein
MFSAPVTKKGISPAVALKLTGLFHGAEFIHITGIENATSSHQ